MKKLLKRLYFMSLLDRTRNMDVPCCKKDEDLTMALSRECSKRKQAQRISLPQGSSLLLEVESSTVPNLCLVQYLLVDEGE